MSGILGGKGAPEGHSERVEVHSLRALGPVTEEKEEGICVTWRFLSHVLTGWCLGTGQGVPGKNPKIIKSPYFVSSVSL